MGSMLAYIAYTWYTWILWEFGDDFWTTLSRSDFLRCAWRTGRLRRAVPGCLVKAHDRQRGEHHHVKDWGLWDQWDVHQLSADQEVGGLPPQTLSHTTLSHTVLSHTHNIFTHNWSNTTNTYKYNIVTYSYVIHATSHTTQSDNTLSYTTSHATQQTNLRHMQLCHTQDCHIQLSSCTRGRHGIYGNGLAGFHPPLWSSDVWHGHLPLAPADIDKLHLGFWQIRSFPYVPYIIPHFSITLAELPMYCWLYLIVHAMSAVSPLARIEKSDEDAWIQELLRHQKATGSREPGAYGTPSYVCCYPYRIWIHPTESYGLNPQVHPQPTG